MLLTHDYTYVLAFLTAGLIFGILFTFIPLLLSPKSKGLKRTATYESGEETIGSAWVQFDIGYYFFALMFIAFDVEVIFLFPTLVAFGKTLAYMDLIKVMIFLVVLEFPLLYAWKKGFLNWKA